MVHGDRDGQRFGVAVVYIAAMFMAILDTTIVNVALPTLGRALHVHPDEVGMVPLAYLVSLTVFIPAAGWIGDRFGGRRVLLGAIALFTVGSALAGASTGFAELVAFSIVQGAGGAVMLPVGLAMLFRVYPPAERVRIASIVALFTALAPALGPILGGVLTTTVSWRLVFFVNVPIGIAAVLFGAAVLGPHTQPHPGRLDVRGLLLSGVGLGATMFGVSEGPVLGWSAAPVVIALAVGVALLVAWVLVERRIAAPLLDLRLFRNRLFTATTSLYGLGSVAYIGALYLSALFLQDALGLSALQAGLTIFPSALGVMAGSQLVTRMLYPRVGPRRLVCSGLVLVAVSLALMALVGAGTDRWLVRLIMVGLGVGISAVFVPSQAASMATVSARDTGRASSIFNAGKQLGSAVGVALLTTVVAAAGPGGHVAGRVTADLTGFHAGFLAAAAVALIAVLVAATIRDADAAATMTRRTNGRARRADVGGSARARLRATAGVRRPAARQGR